MGTIRTHCGLLVWLLLLKVCATSSSSVKLNDEGSHRHDCNHCCDCHQQHHINGHVSWKCNNCQHIQHCQSFCHSQYSHAITTHIPSTTTTTTSTTTTTAQLRHHSCNKFGVTFALATNEMVNNIHSPGCAGTSRKQRAEVLVMTQCNTGPTSRWKPGEQVVHHCQEILKQSYVAIATFKSSGHYHSKDRGHSSGVLVGCTTNGLKIVHHCQTIFNKESYVGVATFKHSQYHSQDGSHSSGVLVGCTTDGGFKIAIQTCSETPVIRTYNVTDHYAAHFYVILA